MMLPFSLQQDQEQLHESLSSARSCCLQRAPSSVIHIDDENSGRQKLNVCNVYFYPVFLSVSLSILVSLNTDLLGKNTSRSDMEDDGELPLAIPVS